MGRMIEGEPMHEPAYIPTEAEIATMTAEIRAEWDDDELDRRTSGVGRVPWRPPGCDRGHDVVDRETQGRFG